MSYFVIEIVASIWGAPTPAYKFSLAELKSWPNALLTGADRFEQLLSKELI
jgi:hypothetical protein